MTAETAEAHALDKHSGQAEICARALAAATGLAVREVVFVYCKAGVEVRLRDGDIVDDGQTAERSRQASSQTTSESHSLAPRLAHLAARRGGLMFMALDRASAFCIVLGVVIALAAIAWAVAVILVAAAIYGLASRKRTVRSVLHVLAVNFAAAVELIGALRPHGQNEGSS